MTNTFYTSAFRHGKVIKYLGYENGEKVKFMTVLDKEMHKFEGYTCTAGLKRFMVDPNGDIKRCTKRVGGVIGNIFEDYTLPSDPILCNYAACPCKLDAIVEKWI